MSSHSPFPGDAPKVTGGPAAADRTRAVGQAHSPSRLEDLIGEVPELSMEDLALLVRLDLERHWQGTNRQTAQDYFQRFPTLVSDPELAVDVIYAEYLAQERAGESPDLAEFQKRFPAFAEVLAVQVSLHSALGAGEDPASTSTTSSKLGGLSSTVADETSSEASYEIIEQIGFGGMGVVYKARQPSLNRFVALKMVRAIDGNNQNLLARFRSEARVVASLRHPHIVQVFDFGEHDKLPFLAMELIEHGTLAGRLDGNPWSPRAAAELMVQLADAVQYAHQRQVIHRDLKPANVLVSADHPSLQIKITDFGLAKVFHEEASPNTHSVAFLGTPNYMAPEQARGGARDVGPGADIYALGAILYELLSGRPPFRGENPIETLRQVLGEDPVDLHRLVPRVPRDLATICHKCLHREPQRRYLSAADLRADLERYLGGRPILARPVGTIERTLRWCRRNPAWATAIVSVVTLLCGIALLSLWYSNRLRVELERAQLAEQAQRNAHHAAQTRLWDSYMAEIAACNGSHRIGQRFAALQTIDKATSLLDTLERSDERMVQLRSAILSSVALPDLRTLRTLAAWPADAYWCDAAPAADCHVVGRVTGEIIGYRLSDGKQLWAIEAEGQPTDVSLSSDGRFVAATTSSNTQLWRIDEGKPQAMHVLEAARHFTFSTDGAHAAISRPSLGMQLLELESGQVIRALDEGEPVSPFALHAHTKQIAVCTKDRLKVISSDSGQMIWQLPIEPTALARLAWHPSGEYLAAWYDSNEIVLWDVRRRVKLYSLSHRGNPALLVFNEDGSALASYSSWDQRLLVWQVADGERLLEVPGIKCRAARAVGDSSIWFLGEPADHVVLSEFTCGLRRALAQAIHPTMGYWHRTSIGPEGRIAVMCSWRGLELWDLQTSHRLTTLPIGACNADFDNQGRLLVGCRQGIYRFPRRVESLVPGGEANESASQTTVDFGPPEKLAGGITPTSLATEPSGQSMAFVDKQGWAAIDTENHSELRFVTVLDPRKAAVSPDHRYVAIANWENPGAAVWNAATGEHVVNLAIGPHGVVEFSPDGRWLAATPDGITLWQVGSWQRQAELRAVGTTPTGLGIAFSPDSRALAVGQSNGVLRIVDTNTMSDWARLSRADLNVAGIMAFSPDQRLLVTSSIDERAAAEVWDLEEMLHELSRRGLMDGAGILPVLPRSASIDGRLRVTIDDGGLLSHIDEASISAPDSK